MKAGKIALILIVVFCLMQWVRAGGNTTPLPATFPGLGGPGQSPLFIAGGIVMLAITAWGLARQSRGSEGDDDDDEEDYAPEAEDDDDGSDASDEQEYGDAEDEEDT